MLLRCDATSDACVQLGWCKKTRCQVKILSKELDMNQDKDTGNNCDLKTRYEGTD